MGSLKKKIENADADYSGINTYAIRTKPLVQ